MKNIDAFFDAMNDIDDIRYAVIALMQANRVLHNHGLADNLEMMAASLKQSTESARSAVSMIVSNTAQQAEASSRALVAAAISCAR